jgi:DNA repair exonuclease SbcCD nuclease subunit
MKFLHISDVHLGCTRYQLPESPRDFFDAWIDVLRKYAIGENVEFVIICGDFFHKRNVPPETMNYAVAGLNLLKEAGIPVVAIEGNHDQKHTDSEYSWLRSLSNWNLLYLLEPTNEEGRIIYKPWDDGRGGFGYRPRSHLWIPLVRRVGELGDTAFDRRPKAASPRGRVSHPDAAYRYRGTPDASDPRSFDREADRTEGGRRLCRSRSHAHALRDRQLGVQSRLDRGHEHREYRETRGVFLVEVDDENKVTAKHIQDYQQRPFQRLSFDVSPYADTHELTRDLLATVSREARVAEDVQPIVEITLRGQLGFPNSLIESKKIREEAQKLTGALHIRLKNVSLPVEYAVAVDLPEDAGREIVERRVVEDLVVRDKRFKTQVSEISDVIIGAKRLALSDEEPEKIADFIRMAVGK